MLDDLKKLYARLPPLPRAEAPDGGRGSHGGGRRAPGPHRFLAVSLHLQLEGGFLSDWAEASSATTRDESNVRADESPLTTWRHRLTEEQVKRILEVVGNFGLDFYDDSLLPYSEKLAGFLDTESRSFSQS